MIPSGAIMRLSITIPSALKAGWHAASDTRIMSVSHPRVATITIGALIPLPDDVPEWVRATLRSDIQLDANLQAGGLVEHTTQTGWLFRLADARVLVGDAPTEIRLGAFYRFFEYTAAALVCIPGGEPAPTLAREAIDILATGSPNWSDQIVGVHQLWAGLGHQST